MPPDALALIRRAKAEAKAAAAREAAAGAPEPEAPKLSQRLGVLERHAVAQPPDPLPTLPNSACYLPEFVSDADEATVLQHILGAPPERWAPGRGRRTQNWGGRPGELQISEALPEWLRQLVEALSRSGAWPSDEPPPNHVIINEYEPGAGLPPHTDGPLYAPCVAVLSLMSDVVIELHRPEDAAVACEAGTRLGRLLLRRRSLNVLRGDAYRCFHGIPWAESDVVDEAVANLHLAGGASALGEQVLRARRVSIVFVAKLT